MQVIGKLNTYQNYLVEKFGERVQKVPLNSGFSCPNLDGTLSNIGCSYCRNDAFSPFYCDATQPVVQQLRNGMQFFGKKYGVSKFFAYFQSFSGTNASIDELYKVFSSVIDVPGVVGLVIATRPDCIDSEKLHMLKELSAKKYISIEIGIESTNDNVLKRINRGHTYKQSADAVRKIAEFQLSVGGHIILGLPGESSTEHIHAAQILSELPLSSIKIHHLQILRGTKMADEFAKNPEDFKLFSLAEHIERLADFVENLRSSIAIDRFNTRSPLSLLISPRWNSEKNVRNCNINSLLEDSLIKRGTWQGKMFKK
ncbi:MAG: TIGR01212 family radical SAM protein [Candidatus Riflebacteria bacterium]|nr:TIGR01212 family radical SAM protein [Candidatus Riflebacteria bacterium]